MTYQETPVTPFPSVLHVPVTTVHFVLDSANRGGPQITQILRTSETNYFDYILLQCIPVTPKVIFIPNV